MPVYQHIRGCLQRSRGMPLSPLITNIFQKAHTPGSHHHHRRPHSPHCFFSMLTSLSLFYVNQSLSLSLCFTVLVTTLSHFHCFTPISFFICVLSEVSSALLIACSLPLPSRSMIWEGGNNSVVYNMLYDQRNPI